MCKKITLFFLIISVGLSVYGNDQKQEVFDTLTFSEAAALAIAASVDLRHLHATQDVMEGAWKWGLRVYFPKFSINISENDRLQKLGSDSFIKNYGINIDQLVWDGGRTRMSRRIERMDIDLSSSRLEKVIDEIAEAAISAYRNVLAARAILEIKTAALSVLEEQRRIINEEVQLGLVLAIDAASADINLADAKLDIYSLKLDLTEMEKQFAELLGLDTLPVLTEKVDVNRTVVFPAAMIAAKMEKEKNPDLIEIQHSMNKRQMELKYVQRSWIPALRLNGNFGLSGQRYPLTRYNWSVGVSIELSNPWLSNRFSMQAGWEPPHDRTAMVQNGFSPLPDPAASYNLNQAKLALNIEQEKYYILLDRIGRITSNAIEKCTLAEQKRLLAVEAAALGNDRCRIEETRLGLGYITRLRLMEIFIEQTQREIAVIQAATALLEAERELERFLDLKPGELSLLAELNSAQQNTRRN